MGRGLSAAGVAHRGLRQHPAGSRPAGLGACVRTSPSFLQTEHLALERVSWGPSLLHPARELHVQGVGAVHPPDSGYLTNSSTLQLTRRPIPAGDCTQPAHVPLDPNPRGLPLPSPPLVLGETSGLFQKQAGRNFSAFSESTKHWLQGTSPAPTPSTGDFSPRLCTQPSVPGTWVPDSASPGAALWL